MSEPLVALIGIGSFLAAVTCIAWPIIRGWRFDRRALLVVAAGFGLLVVAIVMLIVRSEQKTNAAHRCVDSVGHP